jgi:hypothetical protein
VHLLPSRKPSSRTSESTLTVCMPTRVFEWHQIKSTTNTRQFSLSVCLSLSLSLSVSVCHLVFSSWSVFTCCCGCCLQLEHFVIKCFVMCRGLGDLTAHSSNTPQ